MGTEWSVRYAATAAPCPADAIQRLLDGLVAELSHWQSASLLSRFNRALAGSWHSLPPDFFTVLEEGVRIATLSDGAFDPALGALVELWGFGAGPPRAAPPDAAEIDALRSLPGWRTLALDVPARRAFQPGGVALDFSGIAKGHAVDRIVDLLAAHGVRHALVEVGGELRGEGVQPDGQPWWVALEAPPGSALGQTRIALHGLSVATSGDYRRWFEADGLRYPHSLDPRTGRPIAHGLASVSVVHPACITADALATALTVLGPERGMALAAREGIASLFVRRVGEGFEEMLSPAMVAMLD